MNLKLNGAWDLAIENNQLVLFEGIDEITQLVCQRLKTFYGEWFLDTSIGIPYFQVILEKNPNPSTIEAIFVKEIIETDGIIELTSIVLDIDDSLRHLAIDCNMISTDGVIEFSTIIGG